MNEQIKQIADRLRGLRDALDLSPEELAAVCRLGTEEYLQLESGESDIPVSVLHQVGSRYGVDLSALLFGDEPKMSSYFLTRKGKGAAVERTRAYKYQSLAAGFKHRKGDPFLVTVEPSDNEAPMHLNTHPGQEFNLVIEGCLLLSINGKELILHEGDSIYFDATRPHGMRALNNEPVRFLAVII